MNTQHTPGPWTAFGGVVRSGDNGSLVADTVFRNVSRSPEEIQSNARLIAAAPTMYKYLTKLALGGDDEAHEIVISIERMS